MQPVNVPLRVSAVAHLRQLPLPGVTRLQQCQRPARPKSVLLASPRMRVLVRSRRVRLPSPSPAWPPRCLSSIPRVRVLRQPLPPVRTTRRPQEGIHPPRAAATPTCTPLPISSIRVTLVRLPRRTLGSVTMARRPRLSIRVPGAHRLRSNTVASMPGGEDRSVRAGGSRWLGRMTHGPCLDGQGLLVVCPMAGLHVASSCLRS